MAKNKLADLNDHLFAQIEKLTDPKTKDLDLEIARADALAKLADQVVKTHKLVLDAARFVTSGDPRAKKLPETFGVAEEAGSHA